MKISLAERILRAFAPALIALLSAGLGLSAASAVSAVAPSAPEMTIKRQPIQSSSIASAGYRARLRVLEIQFHTGVVYRYSEVPPSVFKAFLKADSKGRYFVQHIRNRFAFRRMEDQLP